MITSIWFYIFIGALMLCYYGPFRRYQWQLLLIGSWGFYIFCGKWYFLYMLTVTVITYIAAVRIQVLNEAQKKKIVELQALELEPAELKNAKKQTKALFKQKRCIITGVISVILIAGLLLFKCAGFLPGLGLILPLGISYYTFQSIGYVVDVYRGNSSVEKNFAKYALFVAYFPQMIEGPINKWNDLSKQLINRHSWNYENIRSGVWLFMWGLFKKMVIADRAAIFVNTVFSDTNNLPSGSICMMGIFFFNLQLYGDFSGGIDMVRGVSQIFGINMAENFKRPFFAESITDYWHRWHITLGNWIRDMVFYPLAFSKTYASCQKKIGKYNEHLGKTIPAGVVSIITFLLIGLWHDISLAYVAYGVWHGGIMAVSAIFAPVNARIVRFFYGDSKGNAKDEAIEQSSGKGELFIESEATLSGRLFRRIRTFLLVSVGEVFTVLGTFAASMAVFKQVIKQFKGYEIITGIASYGLDTKDLVLLTLCVIAWIYISSKQEVGVIIRDALAKQPLIVRCGVTVAGVMLIVTFGIYGMGYDASAFIYGGI